MKSAKTPRSETRRVCCSTLSGSSAPTRESSHAANGSSAGGMCSRLSFWSAWVKLRSSRKFSALIWQPTYGVFHHTGCVRGWIWQSRTCRESAEWAQLVWCFAHGARRLPDPVLESIDTQCKLALRRARVSRGPTACAPHTTGRAGRWAGSCLPVEVGHKMHLDSRWADNQPTNTSSNHTDWLRCFNTTASLAHYTRAIYGTDEPPADFEWSMLDVLYPHLLHGFNKTCFFDSDKVYRREIIGAFFVDYPERTRIPNGALINRGGHRLDPSRLPPMRTWPWIEVMHAPHYGISSQGHGNLWMYIARGSGLWFDPGRVLALSDVWDLALYLNMTHEYNPRLPSSKTYLMQLATQRLRGVFDSIAFAFHVDGGCCQRMVMRELVSLKNFSAHCPISPSMRRGWPPDLKRCNCSHSHSRSIC